MKRLRFKAMWILLLCISLSLICTSCEAKTRKNKRISYSQSIIDNSLHKMVGDSIMRIIMNSSNVHISQLSSKNDSLCYNDGGYLKKEEKSLILFLILDDEMNRPAPNNIFAKFCPMIRISFNETGKRSVSMFFDFGLSQWTICDSKENEIAKGMLTDRQLLRFCHYIFPDNEAINRIYDMNSKNK